MMKDEMAKVCDMLMPAPVAEALGCGMLMPARGRAGKSGLYGATAAALRNAAAQWTPNAAVM